MLAFCPKKIAKNFIVFVLILTTFFGNTLPIFAEEATASARLAQELTEEIPQLNLPFDDKSKTKISLGFGEEYPENIKDKLGEIGKKEHTGIDFAMDEGTPILAVDEGEVVEAGDGDFGKQVRIKHKWGESIYGHLSGITVKDHQTITKGLLLGLSGNTGQSSGPHLHFGVKQKSDWVDPSKYLDLSGILKIDPNSESDIPKNAAQVLGLTEEASAAASLDDFLMTATDSAKEASSSALIEDLSDDPSAHYAYKFDLNSGVTAYFLDKRTGKPGFAIVDDTSFYKVKFSLKEDKKKGIGYRVQGIEKQEASDSAVIANPEGVKQSSLENDPTQIATGSANLRNDDPNALKVEGDKIEFPTQVNGIPMTLRYTVGKDKIKEEFIISEKPTDEQLADLDKKFNITFDTSIISLRHKMTDTEDILSGRNGAISWTVREPTLEDSTGQKGDVQFAFLDSQDEKSSVQKFNKKGRDFIPELPTSKINQAVLSLDSEFLKTASYPVVIDPTVVINTASASTATQPSNMKHIVRTSDGVLHSFVQIGTQTATCGGTPTLSGLGYFNSADNGATWTCQAQLSSNTTNLFYASATTDASDNVYVTYSQAANGAGTTLDVNYRKLTNAGGGSWTVGTERLVLDGTAGVGYAYSVMEKEATNSRLWLAARYFDGTNYQVTVYYSSDLTDNPTWTQSIANLDTLGTQAAAHFPVMVKFGAKIGVIYNNNSQRLQWRFRADADGLTSWVVESAVPDAAAIASATFTAVGVSGGQIYLANNRSTVIEFDYFNGNSWNAAVTTVSSTACNACFVSLSTDGSAVWVFYGDTTSLTSTLAGNRKLVYKKGVAPFAANNFDATATNVNSYQDIFDQVWLFDSGGATYEDLTTAAGNTTTADVKHSVSLGLEKVIGDIAYFGKTAQFDAISWVLSTAGTTGVQAWEYCTAVDVNTACTTWSALTFTVSSNPNFTATTGNGVFTTPGDWVQAKVNSESTAKYYIRARTTTGYGTLPIGTQFTSIPQITWANFISAPGSNTIYGMWTENAASPFKVRAGSISVTAQTPAATADISPAVLGYSSSTLATQTSTMRKIVRTSDGTIHAFVQSGTVLACGGSTGTNNAVGLNWLYSTDSGSTWTCGGQLSSDTTNLMYGSATTDSSDNIYVTYSMATTTGGAAKSVYYRKLTKGVGATWTLGTERTVLTGTGTVGYHYAVIEKENTNDRLWIAARYFDGTNYQVTVYYSSDLTDNPTWTQSVQPLDTANTSASGHYPTLVRYGSKMAVLYYDATTTCVCGYWRFRNDSDGLTSWSSVGSIGSGAIFTAPAFSAVGTSDGRIFLAVNSQSSNISLVYYNGSAWTPAATTLGTTPSANITAGISTDGSSVWVYYLETTGLSSSLSGLRKLMYRKCYAPYATNNCEAATAVVSQHDIFDKVWTATGGGVSFSDQTTPAGNTTAADTTMISVANDAMYFGKTVKFDAISWDVSTSGTVGTTTWEYYNGSTWVSLTNTSANSAPAFTADGYMSFTPNSDWATTSVNGEGSSYYYIRARATGTYTVTPIGTQFDAIPNINWAAVLSAPVSNTVYSLWAENAASPVRIRFTGTSVSANSTQPGTIADISPTLVGYSNAITATQASTQRNIVRTSDGTLHSFVNGAAQLVCSGSTSSNNSQLLNWVKSTDSGSTWSCGGALQVSDTTDTDLAVSATVDSSDNIYIVYSRDTSTGGTTKNVYYRKFTYNGGSSWTMGSEQTAIAGSSTIGYHYAVIEKESTNNRLWIAARYYDGANYQVSVYYSSDLSASPTWTVSQASLDTAGTSANSHFPGIVKFGSKIGVIYRADVSTVRWRFRSDTDGVTTWNTESEVNGNGLTLPTFSVVGTSSGQVFWAANFGTSLLFTYYNGTNWSGQLTLATSQSTSFVSLATDGTAVWVIYSDITDISRGKLVYKKGVAPFDVSSFDATATLINSTQTIFDKVWLYNGSTYEDLTTAAGNTTTADVKHSVSTKLVNAVGDIAYFGKTAKYDSISATLSTAGVGGSVTWEYCAASAGAACTSWQSLSGVSNTIGPGFTSTTPFIVFTPNSDWVTSKENSESTEYYYIRARVVTAYTTAPIGTQFSATPNINWGSFIPSPGSSTLFGVWSETNSSTGARVRASSFAATSTPPSPSGTAELSPNVLGYSSTTNALQAPNMKHIVRTSDGTLHLFVQQGTQAATCGGTANSSRLVWFNSTDSGTTWTCQALLQTGDLANLDFAASAAVDSSDNIFVVYSRLTTTGGTTKNVYYRKLTKGVGASWTVGSEQTAIAGTSTVGYHYAVIEKETTNSRLWIATRYYDGVNYQVSTYYSSDISDAPTWTVSQTTLDTAGSSSNYHIPSIVKYGSKIGVIYNMHTTSSTLNTGWISWRNRNDSDGVTTWATQADVTNAAYGAGGTNGSGDCGTLTTTTDSNGKIYVACLGTISPQVIFTYFDGSSWAPVSLLSDIYQNIATIPVTSLGLSTDGTNVWVFFADVQADTYPNSLGFITSPQYSVNRLVYKKGVYPFNPENWDQTFTKLVDYHNFFDKVWKFTSSGSTYTNNTAPAATKHSSISSTLADVSMPSSSGDILYFGKSQKFDGAYWELSTSGVAGQVTWEYYNGSTWVGISNFLAASGSNLTASGYITFVPNTDWTATTINSETTSYYYIRARVTTTYTTSPVGSDMGTSPYINGVAVLDRVVSNTIYSAWGENISAPMRIRTSAISVTPASAGTSSSASLLANTDWPMARGNLAGNKTISNNITPLTLGLKLSAPVSGQKFISSTAIGSNSLYAVTYDQTNNPGSTAAGDGNTHGLAKYNFSGNLTWHHAGIGTDVHGYNPSLAEDGTIYLNNTHNQIMAFNNSGGLKWNGCVTGESYGDVPLIDKNGKIVMMSGSGSRLLSCNPDGSTNWELVTTTAWTDGILSIDSNNVIYMPVMGGGVYAVRGSDGTILWHNSSVTLTAISGNAAAQTALSKDERIVYASSVDGSLYALNTSDGSLIWSRTFSNTAMFGAVGNSGRVYYHGGDNTVYALDGSSGSTIWSYSTGGAPQGYMMVDQNERIYVPSNNKITILSSNGTVNYQYSGASSTNVLSMKSDGTVYFNDTSYLYSLKPWTISLTADNRSPSAGDTVNFTATSTMLSADSAASSPNLVQISLPNGDRMRLIYDSTNSNGESLWKGSYIWPLSIPAGNQGVNVEAIAYQTITNQNTNFPGLPTGFNNTGVSNGLCMQSQATGQCPDLITQDPNYSTNSGYELRYNVGPGRVGANNYVNGVFTVNGEGNSLALVMGTLESFFDNILMIIKRVNLADLISGANYDLKKFTSPQQFGYIPVGDFWDFRAYLASTGMGIEYFAKALTVQIPFDWNSFAEYNNASRLKLLTLDKWRNKWVEVPASVTDWNQFTMASLINRLSVFVVAVDNGFFGTGSGSKDAKTFLKEVDQDFIEAKQPSFGLPKISDWGKKITAFFKPIPGLSSFLTAVGEFKDRFVAGGQLFLAAFDKDPTRISNVRVAQLSSDSVTIYWQTNHPADSKVNFGFSPSYGQEVASGKLGKDHVITLTNLKPDQRYYFEVMSHGKNYAFDAYYVFKTSK